MEWTSHWRPTSFAMSAAHCPRIGGRELVAGLVDKRASEVLAFADDHAFGESGFDGKRDRRWRERRGSRTECSGPCDRCGRCRDRSRRRTRPRRRPWHSRECGNVLELFSGRANTSSRIPRGLAKRTAVPAASRTLLTVALASLPRPTMRSRLAARPAGACRRRVSLAPALYSPVEKHGCCCGFNCRVGGEQRWLGFGVGALGGLGVGGEDGKKSSCDAGKWSKGKLSAHGSYFIGAGLAELAEAAELAELEMESRFNTLCHLPTS